MSNTANRTLLLLSCLALAFGLAAETRFHQYTKKFKNPNHPATPVATGYLGGGGDEYLSGAAFLPDGRLLLGGTCFGPTFDPAGVKVAVLGRDGSAPSFKMPSTTKRGKVKIQPPDWKYLDGAGFVIELAKGHGSVAKAVRFPWGSGSLTSLETDADGGIYVAGICGEGFSALTTAKRPEIVGIDGKDPIFVGKLAADLGSFVWCLQIADDATCAPKLQALSDGNLSLIGTNAYHISGDGEVVKASAIYLTNNWSRGVDPLTHASATGGDGNTNTGYEPWRKPVLFLFDDQGDHTDTFYRWNEKLVGTNWSRLVSDSSTRCLSFDKDGNLLVAGWSDGGNSVFEFMPYDLTSSVKQEVARRTGRKCGLGFSLWGANVGSFCHLMKIDPRTGEPLGKTIWSSYLSSKNKPSGLNSDMLATAADNSLILAGGSAYGLIETGSVKVNTLEIGEDYIGGHYIAILTETMGDIRFSSALPGGGQVPLKRHSKNFSARTMSNSRMIDGKVMVVFYSGAVHDEKFTLIDPAQQKFGGGALDGMYVVLEMDPLELDAMATADDGDDDEKKKKGKKVKQDAGLSGTFNVSEGMNKDWCVLVLRDMDGDQWPAIYLAHPKGKGSLDASGGGSFTILGSGSGVQLLASEQRTGVRLGDEFMKSETYKDDRGRTHQRVRFPDLEVRVKVTSATSCTGSATFNGTSVDLKGACGFRKSKPVGNGVNIGGHFLTTKEDLGLAADDPEAQKDKVRIEFWAPGRP